MKTLTKYVPPLMLVNSPGLPFFGIKSSGLLLLGSQSGWEQATNGVSIFNTFFHTNYIDVAGLSVEEKTVFIEAAATQCGGFFEFVNGSAADSVLVWDIMTSIPVDWANADAPFWGAFNYPGLGFPTTPLNFEHVLYQRLTRFGPDLDNGATIAIKTLDEQSGSLQPTASDRIYCHRVVLLDPNSPEPGPPATGLSQVVIPPVRFVIQAEAREEKDYQYLMRLKKSFDLQNDPDVDKT